VLTKESIPLAKQLLWVFVAGGVGASLRVMLAAWVDARLAERLPHVGTLVVNMIGCVAIGIAAAMLQPGLTRLAVLGGLLGGFTTYSAFALFSVELVRGGKTSVMLTQVALHLVLGMLCAWVGLLVGRALASAP
jgi:CrcB protein